MFRLRFPAVSLLAVLAAALSSVSQSVMADVGRPRVLENRSSREINVPANLPWTDTGYDLAIGETLTVLADGRFVASCRDEFGQGTDAPSGPEGRFDVPRGIAVQRFPLAAGSHGPAPCFCLIGRIGDGPPFFVGRRMSDRARQSGRLYLGINDFSHGKNSGTLRATIQIGGEPRPMRIEQRVGRRAECGEPVADSRVVVFYIDGLRPDVVQEMSAMGHLPVISELFVDGGSWLSGAVTAFPSDTITSNGTMWTGCFSDRHGLKGQVRFSRHRLVSESYLEPLGPSRSARLLRPQGIDSLLTDGQRKVRRFVQGEEGAQDWYRSSVTGTPPIYQFLRSNGQDWSTGLLPLMTELPPLLWTRSMAQELPFLGAHNAWQYVDDSNTSYALKHLLHRRDPVTILWFPETDSVSHKKCRGQFGETRGTIARADALIGRIVEELRATGEFERTYFLLVSDHGHHGGRVQHLKHFDLASDFFYRPREVTQDGRWIGGGMGVSVRMHRHWNRHPGQHQREFVFIDGESDGAARIFLPRKSISTRDWSGPNQPGDLLQYRFAQNHGPIDLVRTMAEITEPVSGALVVDLVLMKLNESSILITTADRGQAVIDRKLDKRGRWIYRYRPVSEAWSDGMGGVFFRPHLAATRDPLELRTLLEPGVLDHYYDERTWLNATSRTRYPDSVVALTRHMLWQKNLAERQPEYAPDLVVTARSGWYFGTKSSPGTMHGYPLADSMRASWFVAGPNVRRQTRIDHPCRLADLTPTILRMAGVSFDESWFDGEAILTMFEGREEIHAGSKESRVEAVYWRDLDLAAWNGIDYSPMPLSPRGPRSINNSDQRFDLNNSIYNVVGVADASVFRIADSILSPRRERSRVLSGRIDSAETRLRRSDRTWVAQGVHTLNISEVTLGDYSFTSLGNLQRVSGTIDWVQGRSEFVTQRVGDPGKSRPVTVLDKAIDTSQDGFWELYRFGQRLIVQTLDESILNGIENVVDQSMNSVGQLPAEIVVDEAE